MLGRHCRYIGKIYRGPGFYERHCKNCPNLSGATIKDDQLFCSWVFWYETFTPKNRADAEHQKRMAGQQAPIPLVKREQWGKQYVPPWE